jgi:hypothetical protein
LILKILDLNSKQVITLVLYFLQELGCSSPDSDFGVQVVISCFKVIPSFCFEDWINFFCVVFLLKKKRLSPQLFFFRNSFVDCNHEYIFPSFLVHLEIIDLAADLMFWFFLTC